MNNVLKKGNAMERRLDTRAANPVSGVRLPLAKTRSAGLFATCIAAAALATPAAGQDAYPSKPIRVVVAFAAGGFADSIARTFTPKLAERLGQPVVVENRGGAGGNIAAAAVARSAPDGYTLLAHTAAISISNSLYRSPGFSLLDDLVPISNTGSTPGLFSISASHPAASLPDLIRRAKQSGLTYGTGGVGTSSHLAADYLFSKLAGLKAVHVPFKGGAPSTMAVVAGQVEVHSGSLGGGVALNLVRQGKLRALAVSSPKRSSILPNVPTVAESGFPGFEETSWVGFFAPAKTPASIVERLNREINWAIGLPDVNARLVSFGMDPEPGSAAEFAAYVKREAEKWARIVKATGIVADD